MKKIVGEAGQERGDLISGYRVLKLAMSEVRLTMGQIGVKERRGWGWRRRRRDKSYSGFTEDYSGFAEDYSGLQRIAVGYSGSRTD